MIAYLEGQLLKKDEERILLLVHQVGYEVLVPAFVRQTMETKNIGDQVALFIYYHQTERQPKPVLIGFNLEAEKEFFQYFISVDAMGPLKAVKALTIPVGDIAEAIETNDISSLKHLKGIGERTGQKIIATLRGKVSKFALIRKQDTEELSSQVDIAQSVLEVLIDQLGHRPADAKRMVNEAMNRNKTINSPEALFDEVYKGEKK